MNSFIPHRIAFGYLLLWTNFLLGQTDFETSTNWVGATTVTSATSPTYSNTTCNGIQYTISTTSSLGFQYESAVNGTGVIFPGTSGSQNIIHITISFNSAVENPAIHIIDLDEDNHNDGGTAEEYLYNFSTAPSSVVNTSSNPIYLSSGSVTPYDGNSSTQNNNTSGWIHWTGNISTLSFDYYRIGNTYEFMIDSIDFSCPCPTPIIHNSLITKCPTENSLLSSSFVGTSYMWNTGATTQTLSTLQAGNYWVKTYNGSCWNMDSFSVTNISIPNFSLPTEIFLCEGEDTTLTLPNTVSNMSWQNGSTNSYYTTSSSETIIVNFEYQGCPLSLQTTVLVSNYPTLDNIDSLFICEGTNVILTNTCSACNHLWSTGQMENEITVHTENWYWVELNNLGCITIDSVYVKVKPLPVVSTIEDTIICQGGTALFTAVSTNNLTSFEWSNGSSETQFSTSDAGNYWLIASLNGCLDTFSFSVHYYPNIAEHMSVDSAITKCEGKSILIGVTLSSDWITIQWGDGSTTPFIAANDAGIYTYELSTPCEVVTGNIEIKEEQCFCAVYIPNAFTPDGNEFNNTFQIGYDCPLENFDLTIYNRWGELLWETKDPTDFWDGTYRNQPVQDGVYVYKVLYTAPSLGVWEEKTGHVSVLR